MSKEKEDTALIELDNRLKALEARIKKLENWKLQWEKRRRLQIKNSASQRFAPVHSCQRIT